MNIFSKEWTPPSPNAAVQSPDMEKTLFRPSSPSDRGDSFQSWLDRTDRHFARDEGSPRRDSHLSQPRESEWKPVSSRDQSRHKDVDADHSHRPVEKPSVKENRSEEPRPSTDTSQSTGVDTAVVEEAFLDDQFLDEQLLDEQLLDEQLLDEQLLDEQLHEESSVEPDNSMLLQHLALLLGDLSGLSEDERRQWIQFLHTLKAQDHSQSSYGIKLHRLEGMSVKEAVNTLLKGLKEHTQPDDTSTPSTLKSGLQMLHHALEASEDGDLESKTLVSTDGIPIMTDETTDQETETGTPKPVSPSISKDGQNPTDSSQDTTKIPVQEEKAPNTLPQAKSDPDQAEKQLAHEKTHPEIPLQSDQQAGKEGSTKADTQKADTDEPAGKESLIKVPQDTEKVTQSDQDLSKADRPSSQAHPAGNQEKDEAVAAQKSPALLESDRSAPTNTAPSSSPNTSVDPDLANKGIIAEQPVLMGQVAVEQDQSRKQVLPNRRAESSSFFAGMQQMPKEAVDKAETLLKLSKTFLERFQQVKLEQGGLKIRVEEFYVRKLSNRVDLENPQRRSGKPVRGNEPTDHTKSKPIIQPRPKAQSFSPYDRQPSQGRMATVSQLMSKAVEGQNTRQSDTKERATWRQEIFQTSSESQKALKANALSRQQGYFSPRSSITEVSESRTEDKALFAKTQAPTMNLEQQIRFSPQVLERSMEEMIQKVQEMAKLARQTLHTATIQLNPPQLGKVELEIQKMGSKILISMQVETEQAKEMLQRNSHLLVSRLSITGYDVQRIHIHMEKHEEQGDHHQQQNHAKQDEQEQQEHNPKARQQKGLEDQALTPEFSFAELLKGVEQHA